MLYVTFISNVSHISLLHHVHVLFDIDIFDRRGGLIYACPQDHVIYLNTKNIVNRTLQNYSIPLLMNAIANMCQERYPCSPCLCYQNLAMLFSLQDCTFLHASKYMFLSCLKHDFSSILLIRHQINMTLLLILLVLSKYLKNKPHKLFI